MPGNEKKNKKNMMGTRWPNYKERWRLSAFSIVYSSYIINTEWYPIYTELTNTKKTNSTAKGCWRMIQTTKTIHSVGEYNSEWMSWTQFQLFAWIFCMTVISKFWQIFCSCVPVISKVTNNRYRQNLLQIRVCFLHTKLTIR